MRWEEGDVERVVLFSLAETAIHNVVVSYMFAYYTYTCNRWGRHVNCVIVGPSLRSECTLSPIPRNDTIRTRSEV